MQPERKTRSEMRHADDALRFPRRGVRPAPWRAVAVLLVASLAGCAGKWAGAPAVQETVEGRLITVQYIKAADGGYDVRATVNPLYTADSTYDPDRMEAGADRAMARVCGAVRPSKENVRSGYSAFVARYRC